MNYYLILGIDSDASEAEIKDAYRHLVLKYHPDHFGEDSSSFLKIQEAYQVLSDPELKRRYDQSLATAKPRSSHPNRRMPGRYPQEAEPLIPGAGSSSTESVSLSGSFETYSPSFSEIFDRILTNFGHGMKPKSERMEELKVKVTLNSSQAASGGSIKLSMPIRIECPLCEGTGYVGFWECHRCLSYGFIDTDLPLIVSYPGGIQNTYSKSLSLNRFGIDNFFLTVFFQVTE